MDLRSHYLGLELANPFVPSSTPLSKSLDSAKQLEDAGAGALIMHSLFQEQIEANRGADTGNIAGGDLLGGAHNLGSREEYLVQFRQLHEALDIPVIPSLNGSSPGDWVGFAEDLEAAGAPALGPGWVGGPRRRMVTRTQWTAAVTADQSMTALQADKASPAINPARRMNT